MTIRTILLCVVSWTAAVAAALPPPSAVGGFSDIRSRIDALAKGGRASDGEGVESAAPISAGDGEEAQAGEGAEVEGPTEAMPLAEAEDEGISDTLTERAGQEEEANEGADATDEESPGVVPDPVQSEEGEQAAEQGAVEKAPSLGEPRTASVVYTDLPRDAFRVEEWAAELVESGAEEGEHIRNGWTLVVVRMAWSGDSTFRRLIAKRRAMDILREHHPELPGKFKASSRILADVPEDDGTFTFVQGFRL